MTYNELRFAALLSRKPIFVFVTLAVLLATTAARADKKVQAELRFEGHSGADKKAGVWIDGQYVGYVKELNGDKKVLLLPGKHQILVRQAWYRDYNEQVVLEPGEVHKVKLALQKQYRPGSTAGMGELKISADPARAAVFVDEQFAGHVDEFDGVGKAMLLPPGQHRVRIALPGYLPFETTVALRPNQKLKLQTSLLKGSIVEAGALVSKE